MAFIMNPSHKRVVIHHQSGHPKRNAKGMYHKISFDLIGFSVPW